MKHSFFLSFLCLTFSSLCFAQNDTSAKPWKSPFKTGYARLGINMLGNNLNPSLSPKDNIMNGNLGADMGFVLETGHIFYFLKKSQGRKINVGLDWTIVSVSYNAIKNKWKNYATEAGYPDASIEGLLPSGSETIPLTASIATRLGPVLAINPVEKLVIEIRGQVSAGVYSYLLGLDDETKDYAFITLDNSKTDPKFSDMFLYGIKPSVGITIRRGRLGLAFDYSPGKTNMKYSISDNGNETYGAVKAPFNTIQLKLNF